MAEATRSANGRPVSTGQLGLYVSNDTVSIRGTGQRIPPEWDESTAARMLLAHGHLLAELAETADWLEGMADEVEAFPGRPDAVGRKKVAAAKLRGRAALIRMVAKAKGGTP